MVKNYDDMLSRFYLIPERYGRTDRLTDRQTDKRTDLLYQYRKKCVVFTGNLRLPMELYLNRNRQIGELGQAPRGRGGARTRAPVAGDANVVTASGRRHHIRSSDANACVTQHTGTRL